MKYIQKQGTRISFRSSTNIGALMLFRSCTQTLDVVLTVCSATNFFKAETGAHQDGIPSLFFFLIVMELTLKSFDM